MVTINDIAKYCNVSSATVSYVLSGKGDEHRIAVSTQKRILDAADELGYTRKQVSDSNHLKIAVYFMYKELEMTIPPLIYGISNVISSEILPIDLVIRPYELGQLSDYKYLWKGGGCNAAVIVAAGAKDLNFLETHMPSVPIVLLNRDLPGYSSVSIDHDEAGRLTAEHAIAVGGNDIAMVLNPSTLYGLNLRSASILKVCEEKGIDIKNNLFYGNNQIDTGYEIGWDMIRKNKLHKVIICMYDMVAMGIISALNEAEITVGKDVHVIATSSGLSSLAARYTPPITVVDLKMRDISERCLRLAIALAQQTITEPPKIVVQPSIIYRRSSPMVPPSNLS